MSEALKPTSYLSNWASHATPGRHGPGRKLTIMPAPLGARRGQGERVHASPGRLAGPHARRITGDRYQHMFELHMDAMEKLALPPGKLTAAKPDGDRFRVLDGDTLCCACSREVAAAGRCHRAWAAPFLVRAGWRVILDGVEVSDG